MPTNPRNPRWKTAEALVYSYDLRADVAPVAMEHSTEEGMREYLKKHPGADPKNHTVKQHGKDRPQTDKERAKEEDAADQERQKKRYEEDKKWLFKDK